MKVLEKRAVSFSCNNTVVHLIGEINGIHLNKSICIENPKHGKLEVTLGEVGYTSKIRNTKELFNAINTAIGYWNKNKLAVPKMVKDIRHFGRRQWLVTKDFDVLVNEFNTIPGKSYHASDDIKIKERTVNIKIPSHNQNKISLTFVLSDSGMYTTNLTITKGNLLKAFVRDGRRLMNGNALIKQFQDWVHETPFEGRGKILEESRGDIFNFLFENKIILTDLIEDLNRYKDK